MRTIIIEKVIHEKMDSKIPESDREGQSLNHLYHCCETVCELFGELEYWCNE
jgi:hypothetical protein